MSKKFDFAEITLFENPESSPGFLMWQVTIRWRRTVEQALRAFDLTHPQFVVLATLGWLTREGESTTQATIGKLAALDPNTTSQILRGLEKKDLIRRVIASDSRAKNPSLTTRGSALLEKALPKVEEVDADFFRSIRVDEEKKLLKIFKKLIEPSGREKA